MYCMSKTFLLHLIHTLLVWIVCCSCELKSQLQFLDMSLCPDSAGPSKRTSVSSFQSVVDSDSAASINLNMEQNNVNFHIKKQSKYPHVPPSAEQKCKYHFLQYVL